MSSTWRSLRETAEQVLPLLELYPDTQPYAAWLKPRLDYFQVADELRVVVPPPEAPSRTSPRILAPAPNPPPDRERAIWIKKVADRPAPAGAKDSITRLKFIFQLQNVPPSLVWLAEAESGFNANARSPSGSGRTFPASCPTRRNGLAFRHGRRTSLIPGRAECHGRRQIFEGVARPLQGLAAGGGRL